MRAVSASRSLAPRAGPFTSGQGLGPDIPFEFSCGARLSLTSGSAVAADATAQTKLYLIERKHAFVPIPNGKRIVPWEIPYRHGTTSRELELSLAGVSSGALYDVFVRVNRGRGELVLGPAWTTATAGAGARAAGGAITRWRGYRVLASDPKALYLGTIYGSGSGTVDDSGAAGQRYLWNQYNRVPRKFTCSQASSWAYTSATIRASNANTTNAQGRCSLVVGFAEENVDVMAIGYAYNSTTDVQALSSLALNRTDNVDSDVRAGASMTGQKAAPLVSRYCGPVVPGLNFFQSVEASQAFGTTTFYGTNSPYEKCGLSGVVWA